MDDMLGLGHRQCRDLVHSLMNLQVPEKTGNILTNGAPVGFSKTTQLFVLMWFVNEMAYKTRKYFKNNQQASN
jgi:hypothetical protein